MKFKSSILTLLLIAFFVTGCSTDNKAIEIIENKEIDYSTYQSFWMKQSDYKTMPVCGFNALPYKHDLYKIDMNTEEYVGYFYDAGFNVAYTYSENIDRKEISATIKNCEKYNISYMAGVTGSTSQTNANSLENTVYQTLIKDTPSSFAGFVISDEPSADIFSNISSSVGVFKQVFKLKKYKELLYHVNLFPNYASGTRLSGTEQDMSYKQYVEEYIKTVKPQILSYDYYGCNGKKPNISSGYFENMSVIKNAAKESGIPFWVYIQSCIWGGNERIPNQPDIDYQVNTSLAYGAKGIQYFTYVTPGFSGDTVFDNACITRDGEKTDTYYFVQNTNKNIAAVDEVLMCSINQGVIVSGETPCDIPECDVISEYKNLKSVTGNHILTGCFDYEGKQAFYIVNNDVCESDTVTLKFDSDISGFKILNTEKTQINSKNELSFELEPSKAVLVVLTND